MAESFLLGNAPIPITDAIARPKRRREFTQKQDDPLEGTMTDAWVDYISRLVQTVQASATRISSAGVAEQESSIAATDISGAGLKAGVYRITWYARITRAAGGGSSLTITVSWTDGGVAQTFSGAAMVGNTTTTHQSQTYEIRVDAGSPIRYETTYGSAGIPTMQYRLDVVLEVIQA